MYIEDGTETLVRIRNNLNRDYLPVGEHSIAMDQETLARYMNDPDIEILEEVMTFSRLSLTNYPDIHQLTDGKVQ